MLASEAARALAVGSIALALWISRLTFTQIVIVAVISGTGYASSRLLNGQRSASSSLYRSSPQRQRKARPASIPGSSLARPSAACCSA